MLISFTPFKFLPELVEGDARRTSGGLICAKS